MLSISEAFNQAGLGVVLYEELEVTTFKVIHINQIASSMINISENETINLSDKNEQNLTIHLDRFSKRMSKLLTSQERKIKEQYQIDEQNKLEFHCSLIKYAEKTFILEVINKEVIKMPSSDSEMLKILYDQDLGLPKSFVFLDRLNSALSKVDRTNLMVSVIMIKITNSEKIVKNYGQYIHKELMIILSNKLKTSLRVEDTVSRFDEDIFGVFLTDVTSSEVGKVIDRLIKELSAPIHIQDYEILIQINIGSSIYTKGCNKTTEFLVQEAKNNLLINVKEEKFNSFISKNKFEIIASLRKALDNNKIQVFYQPQFDIFSEKISSAEALVRWHHPSLGELSPAKFIPLAEESGLINKLGFYVIDKVANDLQKFKECKEDIRIAINLSVRQLLLKDKLLNQVKKSIDCNDLKNLEFEITESLLGDDTHIKYIHELKKLGCTIALDDFGIDKSSLSRVYNLPIDTLKIDKQFVINIETSEKKRMIVQMIIQMAHKLGLKVVVEGVETKLQYLCVKSINSDMLQGNYISKPLSCSSFFHMLQTQEGK